MFIEEYRKLYGFDTGSLRWSPDGGDILKLVGVECMLVEFLEEGKNRFSSVLIKSIGDYNSATMTYQIDYVIDGVDKTDRITPEGFKFDLCGRIINRFIPYSLHTLCLEEDSLRRRLRKLYSERDTLNFSDLKEVANSSEQKKILGYANNIQCVIISDKEELLCFRIHKIILRHVSKDIWRLSVYDCKGKSTTLEISEGDSVYELNGLGRIKIIDLASDGKTKEASGKDLEKNVKAEVSD